MSDLVVNPSGPLCGTVSLPGDKSISHRAVIFASLQQGTCRIRNLLEAEDLMRTIRIFRSLGVSIKKKGTEWVIRSPGAGRFRQPSGILYCGNSGTTMRLMMGVFAALPFDIRLTGDRSLNRRPMERVASPLRRMGAVVAEERLGKRRIIRVQGGRLKGITYRMPVASAQVKSAILLAARTAGVPVRVIEPVQTRDHTERLIRLFRKPVRRLVIPGDPSSAAFFVVAGLINPDRRTRVVVRDICLNPTRTGFLKILRRMGGKIRIKRRRQCCGEPVGEVTASRMRLRGVPVRGKMIATLIDEVPILAVAAASARGTSRFSDLLELRVKESDRIRALALELPRFGITIRERKDGLVIVGGKPLHAGSGSSHGDHRIAMALAILGTRLRGRSRIRDTRCIRTSMPGFVRSLRSLGGKVL